MNSIKTDTVVYSSRVDQAYNKTMDVSDVQIARAGDVSRAITAITDMFGSWGKVLLFLVSPHMLMTMAVCIAAAQCMPCCIRDTKDCCERNAYRNTILRTNKKYTIVAMSISTESDNSNPSTTDDDDDDDDDTDETADEDINNSGDGYV